MDSVSGGMSPRDITVNVSSAIEATAYMAMLRRFGHDAMDTLSNQLLAGHMSAHFLDGLAKLGIDEAASDVEKCALYHVLSNELGGYKLGYIRESAEKAWIFYHVPYQEAHPWMGLAYAALRPSFWINQMRAWHAFDGEAIGNKGIAFVATHFVQLGDPYDAGYFVDRGLPLTQEERLTFNLGERPPAELKISWPRCGGSLWPEERREKAHRNYARNYASAVLLAIAKQVPDEAPALIEFVIRTVLFGLENVIRKAVPDLEDTSGGIEKVRRVITTIEEAAGSRVAPQKDGSGKLVLSMDRGSAFFSADEWADAPGLARTMLAKAASRAWTNWASYIAPDLDISLSSDGKTWTIGTRNASEAYEGSFGARRGLGEAELMQIA
jgi:hypothetical protein